jgi:hypothetical protein
MTTVIEYPDVLGRVFDYRSAAEAENVSDAVLRALEREARLEFPHDPMLAELHVLRAVKAQGKM